MYSFCITIFSGLNIKFINSYMWKRINILLGSKMAFIIIIVVLSLSCQYNLCYADTLAENDYLKNANLLSQNADELFINSRYDSAIILFRQASAIYKSNYKWEKLLNCQLRIGNSFHAQGLYDSALFYARISDNFKATKKIEDYNIISEIDYLFGIVYRKKGEIDSSEYYLTKSLEISQRNNNDSLIALVNKSLGNINFSKGTYDKALEFYNKSLSVEESRSGTSQKLIASLYQNIGIIHSLKDNYKVSKEYFKKSLIIKEKLLTKDDPQLANIYTNYGRFLTTLGEQDSALFYLSKAEKVFYSRFGSNFPELAPIFLNKGSIYIILNDYDKAISYHERALDIYKKNIKSDNYIFGAVYNNIGLIYEKAGQFELAIEYYKKCLEYNLIHESYIRILKSFAGCYTELKDFDKAEYNYNLALSESKKLLGDNYSLTAAIYMDYGSFYEDRKRPDEALEMYSKALAIYLKIFGQKSRDVSNALTYIGIHYSIVKDYDKAFKYFQRGLISFIKDFNDTNIYINPAFSQLELDINLVETLNSKASTQYYYYKFYSSDTKDLKSSLETCRLSIKLAEKIKSSYGEENSKLIMATNINKSYNLAIIAATELFELTKDNAYLDLSFELSEKSKAAVLLSSVRELEAIKTDIIPLEIRNYESSLKNDLVYYKNLIYDENQKRYQDSSKMVIWKRSLFEKTQQHDSLVLSIENQYPEYYNLKYNLDVIRIEDIQNNISKNDALIEYKIADSVLVTFFISKDTTLLFKTQVKDDFYNTVEKFVGLVNTPVISGSSEKFKDFVSTSYILYNILIGQISFIDRYPNLVIIPDDILGYLTFEALLTNNTVSEKVNFNNLNYLIQDHNISYGYSATLLFSKLFDKKRPNKLLAMAPSYSNIEGLSDNSLSNIRELTKYLVPLTFTVDEVKYVNSVFKGDIYIGAEATESKFKANAYKYGILHFAMHTLINDEDPLASKLVFALNNDTVEDGFLNTYEIYNLDLNAELAVLSACKTGFGKLSKGEGVMSLARGFLYAGVPGIVMTLWEIEDISSSEIITEFYKNLKNGFEKDVALRNAKLAYLESADQLRSHPYFWAAYIQIGDNSPVTTYFNYKVFIYIFSFLVLIGGLYILKVLRSRRKGRIS